MRRIDKQGHAENGWLSKGRSLDAALYGAIAAAQTPRIDVEMRRLTGFADHGKLWFSIAALLTAFGRRRGRRAAASGLASLGLASMLANLVAKPLSGRRRPERVELEELSRRHVTMPGSSSFPSGHTASAFAFAVGAGAMAPSLATPLRALAALVGYSRLHTGVHYPADVLAGAVIGVAAGEVVSRAASRHCR